MNWFVVYAWRRAGDSDWEYAEEIVHEHPIRFLIRLRREHNEEKRGDGSHLCYYNYALVFYDDIDETLANEVKDEIG